MTNEQKRKYSEPELLKDILERVLKGKKFRLECGHYVSFGYFLGNDITVDVDCNAIYTDTGRYREVNRGLITCCWVNADDG